MTWTRARIPEASNSLLSTGIKPDESQSAEINIQDERNTQNHLAAALSDAESESDSVILPPTLPHCNPAESAFDLVVQPPPIRRKSTHYFMWEWTWFLWAGWLKETCSQYGPNSEFICIELLTNCSEGGQWTLKHFHSIAKNCWAPPNMCIGKCDSLAKLKPSST